MDHQEADREPEGPVEIAFVGDLTDHEAELSDRLINIPPGGECTLYIDSPGGSPYCAMSLMTLILLRRLNATGIVTGECSSAALWPFAACRRRFVTPHSVLLFHPMKWQSEEHVGLAEAAEWARHFGQLELEMDELLAELLGGKKNSIADWIEPGRYVTGREFVAAGYGELLELSDLGQFQRPTGVEREKRQWQWKCRRQQCQQCKRRRRSRRSVVGQRCDLNTRMSRLPVLR